MESKKIKILMEEILKAVKRIDNKLEKIEEKINKLENIMINIEIQQKYSYQHRKKFKICKGNNRKNSRRNNI